jgi:hypothetical protein
MSSVIGITDEDSRIIEGMNSNAFAPMVLPVVFIMVPIIVSVVTGVVLNAEFPTVQPGAYGWGNLLIWWPLEIWYVVRKWKEAARGSWLSLTYWVGKRFWSGEFLILNWRLLGKIESETNIATIPGPTQVNQSSGQITVPTAQVQMPSVVKGFKYVVEFLFRNKDFPKLWVAMNDLPERELSFVGNSSLVLNGGLLFQTDHVASASFVRCDFYEDELHTFIPIGVFNSDSLISEEILADRKPVLPDKETVAAVAITADTHRAGLYYRKWQDAEAIVGNWENESANLDKRIDDRAGAAIREARKAGQIPIGAGSDLPKNRKLPGTRNQWLFGVALILITLLIFWRLAAH